MATDLATILKLSVPVVVHIGQCEMSMDGVLTLGPGAIIELEKSAEDELDLLANNRVIGTGKAVKVGENFGIRISSIGSPRARIEAMGGDDAAASE